MKMSLLIVPQHINSQTTWNNMLVLLDCLCKGEKELPRKIYKMIMWISEITVFMTGLPYMMTYCPTWQNNLEKTENDRK